MLLFLTALSVFFLASCGRTVESYSKSGVFFDTVILVTLYDAESEPLLDSCLSMAEDYEALFSPAVEGSDIWNINHADGNPVEISKETYRLLKEAVYYAEQTNGRIDPTTLPLSRLWGFYADEDFSETGKQDGVTEDAGRTPPAVTQIDACLSHVGYEALQLFNENGRYTAFLSDTEMQVDLGFIAKGYIADRMKEYLVSQGVKSGIINLGGNVLTIGEKPDGRDYDIGIKPIDENGNPITVLSVNGKSVVTSGIYERCFTYGGISYHHILDAKTGYPAENELYSVTVVSDSSMQGDALSTTCMILGLEEGKKLIENTASCEAVFITKDMEIYQTSGL